jgi:hypothetical protein
MNKSYPNNPKGRDERKKGDDDPNEPSTPKTPTPAPFFHASPVHSVKNVDIFSIIRHFLIAQIAPH